MEAELIYNIETELRNNQKRVDVGLPGCNNVKL
jgi:hypothetical protein